MEQIALFDVKSYDRIWFEKLGKHYQLRFLEPRLTTETVALAQGCRAIVPFVNDELNATVLEKLQEQGTEAIAMRCAGYNNVDLEFAKGKMKVMRVPYYSPYAVAEHTMGLLLCLNRRIHKAYFRTRDFNFSLQGMIGFDLHGKTVGVIGTGKIGQAFIRICKGFGMRVLAYDVYPQEQADYEYVSLEKLFAESDVISLHCPLTEQTKHIINQDAISKMKKGVYLLNTSRGMLIDSDSLLEGLTNGTIAGAGLDVYEEETEYFFEDRSEQLIRDSQLSHLLSLPNVLLTSHQAFLTEEALQSIAEITLQNLDDFFAGRPLKNEIK